MADEKSRGAKINERSDLASTTIKSSKQCSGNSDNKNNIRKINHKINRQSRNGKSTQSSNGNNGNSNRRVRKRKRRFEAAPSTSEKLPTPPPDPRDLEKRRKSLESVVDGGGGVSTNENEPANDRPSKLDRVRHDGLESAFRQLDEWHSLCEQMLELRDNSSRLFQRVRELERCKVARLIEYYLARVYSNANDDEEADDACDDANELVPDKELNFQLSIISSILEQSSSSSHQHQSHTSSASSPSVMAAVWPSSSYNSNNNNYKSSPSSQEQLGVGSGNVAVSRAKSFRSPVLRQRSRSIGEVQPLGLANHSGNKRSSCQIQCGGPYYSSYGGNKSGKRNSIVGPIVGTFSGGSTGPKVSKWTKVKAAFKWEKANMGVPAAAAPPPTSFSSVVLEAIEHEAAQRQLQQQQQNRLKPPETTITGLQIDNVASATTTTTTTTPNSGSSPRTYEHSGPPSPGSISSSSSIDDIFDSLRERKSTKSPGIRETIVDDNNTTQQQLLQRCSVASYDGEFVVPSARHGIAQLSRDSMLCRRMDKGHRTAWGKVKEIIQSRKEGSRRQSQQQQQQQQQHQQLPRNSLRSEDAYSISSLESSEILNEMLGSDQNLKQHQQQQQQQVSRSQTTATSICLEVPSSSASQTSKPASPVAEVDLEPSSRRLTPTLTLTLPSSEELRSVSSPESTSPRTSRSFHHHHHHQHSNSATDASERSPSEDPDSTSSPKQTSCNRHRYGIANPTRRKSLVTMFPTSLSSAAIGGGGNSSKPQQNLQRHDSKWNKVKRAFLSGASSVPPSPSRISSFFDETDGGGGYSASAEDLDNNNCGGASPTHVQTDIQRNAQILHDKLSVEFNRKMIEWNRLQQQKHQQQQQQQQQCGSSRSVGTTSPKDKDSANMLLMGEEQLTPEFKKKLQEWKRMKKGTGTTTTQGGAATTTTSSPDNQLFRKRLSDWQIWRTNGKSSSSGGDNNNKEPAASYSEIGKTGVSEEFLKKMEEWKKIKSGRSDFEEQSGGKQKHQQPRRSSDATPPPANFQDQGWSTIDEEEFQPLDKFIHSLEREQARMEKQREKYANEKSRQNELRSRRLAANGNNVKKEILVQTSTGSYLKFQGISQEFKKKIFEWEKSRGIAPESSTLQLLDPIQKTYSCDESLSCKYKNHPAVLKRSKSMSSVTEKDSREETAKRQPSCVSLTELTNLEKPVLEEAQRCESKRTGPADDDQVDELLSLTRAGIDSDEPEAVIVDIEDVIEETASPMAKFQPQQQPVYSVQTSVTTSIAVPVGTVTASHEPGPLILVRRDDREAHYKDHRRYKKRTERMEIDEIGRVAAVQEFEQQQQQPNDGTEVHDENRKRKFETTEMKVYETIVEEDAACCTTSVAATGEEYKVAKKKPPAESASSQSDVTTSLEAKLEELLKKSTSARAAAAAAAAADFKDRETSTYQRFNETLPRVNGDSEILDKSRANNFPTYNLALKKSAKSTAIYVADETKEVSSSSSSSEGARKLHGYCPGKDQPGIAATTAAASQSKKSSAEDDVVITVNNNTRQKKVLKTRRLTDTQVGYEWRQQQQQQQSQQDTAGPAITVSKFAEVPSVERIIINEDTLNKIVVPTASNERISSSVDGHGGEVDASRRSSAAALRENNCSDHRQIRDSSGGSNKERASGGGDVKPESTNVFVKTKRIIFSPFSRRSNKDKTAAAAAATAEHETKREEQPVVAATSNSKSANSSPAVTARTRVQQTSIQKSKSSHDCPCVGDQTKRPPLPQSPILARKDYQQQQQQQQRRSSPKDAPAPSIRKMIQRYNQKLQEDASSPASSGSGSPIWRSPTSERRVRQQMERYQEEVRRALAAGTTTTTTTTRPGGVEKSASTSVVMQQQQQQQRGPEILKSISTTTMSNEEDEQQQQMMMMMMNQERRKSSLKNPEIFSNIQQCLTQEYTILPIKSSCDSLLPAENAIGDTAAADAAKGSVQQSTEFVVQVADTSAASGNNHNAAAAAATTTTTSLGNISPELIYKLDALSSAAAAAANRDQRYSLQANTDHHHHHQGNFKRLYPSENSTTTTTPLRWVRAQRIKQAKDDFFSREPNNFYPLCSSSNAATTTTTTVESRFRNRHSDTLTTMNDNAEIAAAAAAATTTVSSSNSEFVKSASAGMINVDSRTYQRLSSASSTSNDNNIRHSSNKIEKSSSSSTTTTTTSSSVVEVTGTLSRIASKFRRAKLKRGGNKDSGSGHKEAAGGSGAAGVKMSTVSMLCRQSLLVDLHPAAAAAAAAATETSSKSCPTSPAPMHRDDDDDSDVYRARYKNHRDSN